MSNAEKPAENRPEIGQNSSAPRSQRVCLNCDAFFSPADLENSKLVYTLAFGMECPVTIELYCPTCVEVLSQAMIESSPPWEYPTDAELEAALDLGAMREDYD